MVLVSQIIVTAMVAGCLPLLAIVLLVVPEKLGNWDLGLEKPITCGALVVACGILAARIVVPGVVQSQMLQQLARQQDKEPQWNDLFGVYQTTLIIKAALLEGAIFLLLVAHMVERSGWTLALGGAFLLILLMHMPTRLRVDHWIEEQRDLA